MSENDLTRRSYLQRSSLALGALLLSPEVMAALQHAHSAAQSIAPPALTALDKATAAEIEAIAACILPSDKTPGAREAGVIYFIDRALATFDKDMLPLYRKGLDEAQAKRREMFPSSQAIAGLAAEEQVSLVKAIEKTPFFEAVRTHTLMGFLGSPAWGGNRDQTGWRAIGFDDAGHFEPPFGYYDDPGNNPKP